MNAAAMGVITALVFAEKTLPAGRAVATAAGVGLILFGLATLAYPALLPTQVPVFTV